VDVVHENHIELILRFGGVPVLIPRVPGTELVLDEYGPMHGLLLVEGEDISPSRYGGDPIPPERMQDPDPSKDEIEFALIRKALDSGAAYLGICRGLQILNVARGGDLMADVQAGLGSGFPHIDQDNYDAHRHPLEILPGTPLARWFGDGPVQVNSYHHQGVRRLGKGLQAMARSPDGLVEGLYDPSHPFRVGLQFHPERMLGDYPGCAAVFRDFLRAAAEKEPRRFPQTQSPP
jgi:gamma-glutamyl-gamma-aminobutyrate hydrolase PuuD